MLGKSDIASMFAKTDTNKKGKEASKDVKKEFPKTETKVSQLDMIINGRTNMMHFDTVHFRSSYSYSCLLTF